MNPPAAQLTHEDVCRLIGRLTLRHELDLLQQEAALRAQIDSLKAQLTQQAQRT